MNETQRILNQFAEVVKTDAIAALATVVNVSGSSYRRPGARMLVTSDGSSSGCVSGGCLERDVIRRARQVIETQRPVLCRYDTTDEFDEVDSGRRVALGCAGLIDVYIESVSSERHGPLHFLRDGCERRSSITIATKLSSNAESATPYFKIDESHEEIVMKLPERFRAGLVKHNDASYYVERVAPSQSLVIFGGGHDVVPVVTLAKMIGWHVTVIASHGNIGFRERFAKADLLLEGTEDAPLADYSIEPDAAVVLMTHNYYRDLAILKHLPIAELRYLGLLGPRRRADRLLADANLDVNSVSTLCYAPVGLDIAANTPETIALSIISEIQAVLAGRACNSLRDCNRPIHRDSDVVQPSEYHPHSCPTSL